MSMHGASKVTAKKEVDGSCSQSVKAQIRAKFRPSKVLMTMKSCLRKNSSGQFFKSKTTDFGFSLTSLQQKIFRLALTISLRLNLTRQVRY